MFARYGFRVTDRKRVTKFQSHSKEEVTLCTVVKDLAESPLLYGKDLHREGGRRHGRSEKKLLLSLHDFHPGSREQIGEQLEFCLKRCPGHASILVIPEYHHGPGVEACAESLKSLEKWQRAGHDLAVAFAETPGRFVCAVPAAAAERFADAMADLPWSWIGVVRDDALLEIRCAAAPPATVPVAALARKRRRSAGWRVF